VHCVVHYTISFQNALSLQHKIKQTVYAVGVGKGHDANKSLQTTGHMNNKSTSRQNVKRCLVSDMTKLQMKLEDRKEQAMKPSQ
jgi:hypothetical protein